MSEYKEKFLKGLHLEIQLDQDELREFIDKVIDWALMNGLCMRPRLNYRKDALRFAPFILLPSFFPKDEFENACKMQLVINTLMHNVAYDYEFLKETLRQTIEADDFTKKLFNIYETVHSEGLNQPISLGLLRSDLMLDTACLEEDNCENRMPYCCWKQVEINTIASGFGFLGPNSTRLHRFVLKELGYSAELKSLPENNALEGICSGMIEAWKLYGNPKYVIQGVPF